MAKRKRSLLVLGADGLVGRNFLLHANLANFKVTASYLHNEKFPQFCKSLKKGITPIKINILTTNHNFSSYDKCIYLAGNSNPNFSISFPEKELELNCLGLLRFLKRFTGDIIFLSSAKVYQGLRGIVNPKKTPGSQAHPYAISKLAAENYIASSVGQKKIHSATILRLYYSFGQFEQSRRLMPFLFRSFIEQRQSKIKIGSGKNLLMSPLYAPDLAIALEKCLSKKSESYKTNIFDLPGREYLTIKQIIQITAKICKIRPTVAYGKNDDSHLFRSGVPPFYKKFNFVPNYTLKEAVKNYLSLLDDERR